MSFAFRTGFVTAKRTGERFSLAQGFGSYLKTMSIRIAFIIFFGLVGIAGGAIEPGLVLFVYSEVLRLAGIIVVIQQNAINVVAHVFHGVWCDCVTFNSSSFFEVVKSQRRGVFAVMKVRD